MIAVNSERLPVNGNIPVAGGSLVTVYRSRFKQE